MKGSFIYNLLCLIIHVYNLQYTLFTIYTHNKHVFKNNGGFVHYPVKGMGVLSMGFLS